MSKADYRMRLEGYAKTIRDIRDWLDARGLIEVFTAPVRDGATNDIGIQSSYVEGNHLNGWLQSSPELAMKERLALGSGDIYQICPAFRDERPSPWHQSQFLMLEWYRVGWDMRAIMQESCDFLKNLKPLPIQRMDLAEHLRDEFGISPSTPHQDVVAHAQKIGFEACDDIASAYDFLIDGIIKKHAIRDHWVQCFPYPEVMPALAVTRGGVAMRFEYYLNGIEVGHGYEELVDSTVASARFDQWHKDRVVQGMRLIDKDQCFVDALESCPPAAGVSFGIDRLIAAMSEHLAMPKIL